MAELEVQVASEEIELEESIRRATIAAAVVMAGLATREAVGRLSSKDTMDPNAIASKQAHAERVRREYGPQTLPGKLAGQGVSPEDIERIAAELPWWSRYFGDTPRCGFHDGGELGSVR